MVLQISKILSKDSVLSPVLCFSKKRLLEIIANQAANIIGLPENLLLKRLNSREELGSTFVANGFAVPHTLIEDQYPETAVFVILTHPVHYSYLDNTYADCFLALFLHKDTATACEAQIQKICTTLADSTNCRLIRSVKDIQTQVYNAVVAFCANDETTAVHDKSADENADNA